MNDRLLKESDVIEAFKRRESLIHDVYTATAIIKSVPTADRPQGKWIRNNLTGTFKVWDCSECGIHMETTWNFCPNCGCDMRMKGAGDE